MSGRKRVRIVFLILLGAAAALLAGCATADENESEIPWNTPQPWEGSPMIPGLNNQ
jgi:hypothetical protein